jgi:hypothetical protein
MNRSNKLFQRAFVQRLSAIVTGMALLLWIAARSRVLAMFIIAVIVAFPLKRFATLLRPAARKLLRYYAIAKREATRLEPTPFVEFAYMFSGLLVALGVSLHVSASSAETDFVLSVAMALLAAVSLFDWGSSAAVLAKRAWAKVAWRLILALSTAAAACIAHSFANDLTIRLVGDDPSHFPEFVGLMTVLVTPVVVFQMLLVAAVLPLSIGLYVTLILQMMKDSGVAQSIRRLVSYLRGKSDDRKRRKREIPRPYSLLWRAFGALGIAFVVSLASSTARENRPLADRIAKHALVWLDFHANFECPAAGDSPRTARIDGAAIVASWQDGDWNFKRTACGEAPADR